MICKNNKTPGQIVCEWIQASDRCDLEAVFGMLSDDFKRYGGSEWLSLTKAEYRDLWDRYIEAFSDYRSVLRNYVESGRTVIVEITESAKFTRPFRLSDGSALQPTGVGYTDWDCAWFEVNNEGLITQIRAYLTENLGRQLDGHHAPRSAK